MALINCPECNKEVSDKAEICPNCGFRLQAKSTPAQQQKSNSTEKGKLLFSTKGFFDSGYWLTIIILVLTWTATLIIFAVLGMFLFGIIAFIVSFIVSWKPISKAALLKNSHIELYENVMSGISSDKNYGSGGTTFSIDYLDVTHIDSVGRDEIVFHTTHGDYRAQTYRCLDKVKSIIEKQKKKQ